MADRRKAHGRADPLWQLSWRWLPGREAARDINLTRACAELFSTEYGVWGPGGPHPGARIRLQAEHVRRLLDVDEAWLACAFHDEQLVGYCIAARPTLPEGRIAFVSQLVVAQAFRRHRVATNLLYSIWQFSDCYAWGLITANPFAVRALETATRRGCRAGEITAGGEEVLKAIASSVPYAPPALVVNGAGDAQPKVATEFFIDLQGLPRMREEAARADRPWNLGDISPGEEWFACTFRHQKPGLLNEETLRELLEGADAIWIQAYEGMTLSVGHRWHAHEAQEVDHILRRTGLIPGGSVLDVGCGDGRHAGILGERGYQVTGVDISSRLIEAAIRAHGERARFITADAREDLPVGPFDLALCLYDVLGSSADRDEDNVVLRNIRRSMPEGAWLALSVMNETSTFSRLPAERKPTEVGDFLAALESLPPSSTMEQSGAVFDPEFLIHFDGRYYRKEQFQVADWRLPCEVVVRDKRYTSAELRATVEQARFEVIEVRPVQAGAWDKHPMLEEADDRAKELLLLARAN